MIYPFVENIRYGDRSIPFCIADEIGYHWYVAPGNNYTGFRERCLYFIKPGSHVVDCGSHHGLMTVLFSQKAGPTGRVTAFDALPFNAGVVQRNAELNGLTNVVAHGKAVGQKTGTHKVLAPHSNVILNDSNVHAPDGDLIVDVIALDDADLGNVDFLKIDVEGHEVAALKGARGVLQQLPFLDIEIHNMMQVDARAHCFAIMEALPADGYLFSIDEEPEWREAHEIDMNYLIGLPNPHLLAKPKR